MLPKFREIFKLISQTPVITLYSLIIISTSVFIYITIYNTYVPTVRHTRPVHLQFDSTCQENCSNPYAIVRFNDLRSSIYLARGQAYRFVIALEMPESDINWKQGMFMIRLRLIESQGKILFDISRPAILKYKTLITRLINAIIYWPFLVTNYKNEMQTMHVQVIDNYVEGAQFYFNKMDRALVEILARDIQIYTANLHVIANLSGLSYYMYHWPISSAALGVATLASFMTLLSIYRGHSSSIYRPDANEFEDDSGMYRSSEFVDSENKVDSSTEFPEDEEEEDDQESHKPYFTGELDD